MLLQTKNVTSLPEHRRNKIMLSFSTRTNRLIAIDLC